MTDTSAAPDFDFQEQLARIQQRLAGAFDQQRSRF